MSIILIIAHAPLASALKAVAAHTYAECAAQIEVLDVTASVDVDQGEAAARSLLARHGNADTLILVDVFGATPCKIAERLLDGPHRRILTGVNVPMIWRTLCYGTEAPLPTLADRAAAGATQGVMPVVSTTQQKQSRSPGDDQTDRRDQQ